MLIKTERLLIRLFNENDYDDLYEFYSNDFVCKYLLGNPWIKGETKEFEEKIRNNKLDKDSTLNLAVQLNNSVIGDIHVWYTKMLDTVEIGYVFNPQYQHKGYASEAVRAVIEELFNKYKVHRIQTNLDARNNDSIKLCERVGMRKEAHFIKDYWNKGEWTDSIVFGMLKSDL